MPKTAHIASISINQTVGDWEGNGLRIKEAIRRAKNRGIQLMLFPEMSISGYSLGDRLQMEGTLRRSAEVLHEIVPHTSNCIAVVGLPLRFRGVIYNVAAVLAVKKIVGLVPKENLATGDVQYENRWFAGWPHTRVDEYTMASGEKVPFGGLIFSTDSIGRFAIEICEDGWMGIRPGSFYALAGAHILCNPSASWFVLGKHRIRKHMVEQVSREDHCAYLYTSLMGCDATRLIYDGSTFIANNGEIVEEGRRFLFNEKIEIIDTIVDISSLDRIRSEEGSWRQQNEKLLDGSYGKKPYLVHVEGDFGINQFVPAPKPYWKAKVEHYVDRSLQWLIDRQILTEIQLEDVAHLELELALCLGLHEYISKCGIKNIALALSGGRDSAMVALIVARMYRYIGTHRKSDISKHFFTAYMGTDNSGIATRQAAKTLAEEIGSTHYDGEIQTAIDTHLEIFNNMTGTSLGWDIPEHDIPLQNVQARLRGSLIWMIANVNKAILLSTSNKSEAAVGYTTMDGDTSGGLSPISDVPKSLVIEWLEWAMSYHGLTALRNVLSTPATAELRPPQYNQSDEDDLMPFFVLDQLMYQFVQCGREPLEMFQILWPSLCKSYNEDAMAFGKHIEKFVRLICFAQWKRERFAISFRVTAFDLDPKTGFRFPPVQEPFSREIAEMNSYIGSGSWKKGR